MKHRIEHDTLGEVRIPAGRYWGAQTERCRNNFRIGQEASMPLDIVYGFAYQKKAAAQTNCELGLLSTAKSDLISRVCDEILAGQLDDHFPLVVWQTGSGTQTNMNVNEVISNRAHVLLGNHLGEGEVELHPNDDVNMSQSSNDTFPTAMSIAGYKLLVEETIPQAEALRDLLSAKAETFHDVIKIGRTHFMDAIPLTVQQEISGWAAQINYSVAAISNTLPHLSEIALGGTAVGTGFSSPVEYAKNVADKIANETGLPFVSAPNKFEAQAAHDAIVESHGALKQLAVSLTKVANDIIFLTSGPRSGIGEYVIPSNEPGSSIMPGKVNPTQCEAMTMVCAQVMGNDVAITVGGMNGRLQLNAYKPMIATNFLQSAKLIGDACLSLSKNCIQGIEPNRENCRDNLFDSLMLVTALNPYIGYEKAASIARAAHSNGTTLRHEAIELGLTTQEEFDEWVNPQNMIGSA
jgi:fumarate hydratase class II